jgi:hypothetical protein
MTFTAGQTLTAAVLNSNPSTFSGCLNNIDNTNVGAAGFYASQILPTNGTQATFGGSQLYTFPNGVAAGGPVSGTTGNFSAGVSGTTGTFSSTVSNAGSTSTGAIKQTSGTTYTLPYDANSTAGSTNTHIEHGSLATGANVGGSSCAASTNFSKAFTSAPDLVYGFIASPGGSAATGIFTQSRSASAFTGCVAATSAGSFTFSWMAIGE